MAEMHDAMNVILKVETIFGSMSRLRYMLPNLMPFSARRPSLGALNKNRLHNSLLWNTRTFSVTISNDCVRLKAALRPRFCEVGVHSKATTSTSEASRLKVHLHDQTELYLMITTEHAQFTPADQQSVEITRQVRVTVSDTPNVRPTRAKKLVERSQLFLNHLTVFSKTSAQTTFSHTHTHTHQATSTV